MKTIVLSVVSIILVSIFFCPMILAAPSMPTDLQIVQPDPSLPKELSAFFGKWEGTLTGIEYFVIIEKIEEEKASLYIWRSGDTGGGVGWVRREAQVIKERGKYTLWFSGIYGITKYTLKGEFLDQAISDRSTRLRRVP